MAINIKPLADRVMVEPLEADEKSAGGLYIPDNAKEKPQKGKIIEAGPGKPSENSGEIIKMEVKKGDTVLYGIYSGTEVTVDEKEYLIMRESDILAII